MGRKNILFPALDISPPTCYNTRMNSTTTNDLVLDTPESICAYRELMIYNGLKFEVKTNGKMRLTRNISCYALAKREYGLKGNREKVLAALKEILEAKYGVTLT